MAAVIGRDFDADVLARVAELDEDTVIDGCDRAVAAALLTEGDGAGRYTFAHALIEHALYEGRSAGRRGRIHRTGCGGARGGVWRRPGRPDRGAGLPLGSRHPAPGRGQGDRVRAAGGRSGPGRSWRPTRRCAGTERRSICWTGPPATTRAHGPCCSSGSATRNGRPVIPRTAKRCSRPVASPNEVDAIDILVRSVLRNSRGWMSKAGGVDHERIEMLELALRRLGDSDSPDRARLLALLSVELTWDAEFDVRSRHGHSSRRHGAAHRRRRGSGGRDPPLQ